MTRGGALITARTRWSCPTTAVASWTPPWRPRWALREVTAAIDSPVLVDGGIRRGVDVLRALALGADAVLIGRLYLWGLAVAGSDGVRDVLGQLRRELHEVMTLSGCPTLQDITTDLLTPA